MKELWAKIKEALVSTLPITAIVYILALTPWFHFSGSELIGFTIGAVLLILGIGLFSLGADLAMTPMGAHVGAGLSRQKKLGLLLTVCFVLGMLITIAEPDLQVLAEKVSSIVEPMVLTCVVGAGVGAFLLVAILRIVFKRRLGSILMLFYMLLFAMALMLLVGGQQMMLPLAFDSGGVTTGPITVPFIMALGVGISSVLGDRHSQENSFGLVALCSIGPMLAVVMLGIFKGGTPVYEPAFPIVTGEVGAICLTFVEKMGHVAESVAIALGLIVGFFLICQIAFLRLPKRRLMKIAVGVVFTYVGLVMFLTGVEVGFSPVGFELGKSMGQMSPAILTGFGLITGILVVLAEPAIHVLNEQVEEITSGYITKRSMLIGLCMGVGAAIALSMIRIVLGFSLVYYIVPGYFISLALSLFVPPMYTAVAFDSGGVASGPMTSGFILPFAIGACIGAGGDVLNDAFGVVAMVAMTPLITIQLLGFRAIMSAKVRRRITMKRILDADDEQIIYF